MTLLNGKRTYAGGAITPELWYSSDLRSRQNGASEIHNMIVTPRGGVMRTPGTEYIATLAASGSLRLKKFIPNRTESYMGVYRSGNADIYPADDPSSFVNVATHYVDADLPFIQTVQSKDVQWQFSGKAPKELQRTAVSPDAFSFVDMEISGGPYLDRNPDEALTVSISDATVGTGRTLTASAALFDADQVGAFFKLTEKDFSSVDKWEQSQSYSINDLVRYNGNVYKCSTAGSSSNNPPNHLEGKETDGNSSAVEWEYIHSGFGIVKITAFTDNQNVTVDVLSELPADIATSGTSKWQEGAWSDYRGWPTTGAFYKSALWAAATSFQPAHLWKSAIEGFEDWEQSVFEDGALSRPLLEGETESIYWLAPASYMAIGTDGPEWTARPASSGDTVRTNNLRTEIATNIGASAIPGIVVNGVTLFIDAALRQLVGMSYDFRQNDWIERQYSLFAHHLLEVGVVDFKLQRTPFPILWLLLSNGKLAAMTFLPAQELLAWHDHDFGGNILSIDVCPVEGGTSETVFLVVEREVNGSTERHFERMYQYFDPYNGETIADAKYLANAKYFSFGSVTTALTGLTHLEGQEVVALVDGKQHPPKTVSSGNVTLDFGGEKVLVGLSYESRLKSLPFDAGQFEDYQAPKQQAIRDLHIAFVNTQGGEIAMMSHETERTEKVFKLGSSPLDQAPALYTGLKSVDVPSKETSVYMYRNSTPWPALISSVYAEHEVD